MILSGLEVPQGGRYKAMCIECICYKVIWCRGKCRSCYHKHIGYTNYNDPDKQSNRNYKRKYGITKEEKETMACAQNAQCAICSKVLELYVDHCHNSGKVRGLLCLKCNSGIGFFNDDVDLLQKAIEYLQK